MTSANVFRTGGSMAGFLLAGAFATACGPSNTTDAAIGDASGMDGSRLDGSSDVDGATTDAPRTDAGADGASVDDEPPFVPTATFFVSTTGNDDTGDGSSARPWRTLFKATSTVSMNGALIKVLAGVYTESQTSNVAVGVSIEGEGDSTVIQSSLSADWTPILSLSSTIEGTAGDQHISNLKLDGQHLTTFWAVRVIGRSNVSIHHCTIVDFNDRGVMFDGRTDNMPAAPTTFATHNRFHHNTVHNCAAYNLPTGIYGRGALNIGGQDGMVIHDNVITQTERPAGYNGWPIKYDLDGYLRGVRIYNNVLTKNLYVGNYGGDNDWDFAIELWNGLGGNEIYGNTIQGAVDLVNSYKTTYEHSFWVHDNLFTQPTLNDHFQDGIIFEQTALSPLVENNVFDHVSGGIVLFIESFPGKSVANDLSDVRIRRNLFSNIGRNLGNQNNGFAINVQGSDTATFTFDGLFIDNNTVVAAPGNAPWEGIQLGLYGTIHNVRVANNSVSGGFADAWLYVGATTVADGLTIEHNNSFGNQSNNGPRLLGSGTAPVMSGNLQVDPMFISGTDYHLQAASPLVNAGVDVGLPFTGSAPDIGYGEQ